MLYASGKLSTVWLAVVGGLFGALSWMASSLISGKFEPYDSSVGMLLNQCVLSAPAAFLAFRHRLPAALLFLLSAYFGMNFYVYAVGNSETRGWAGLGAIVSLVLFIRPTAIAVVAAILRRLLRAKKDQNGASPRPRSE